MHMNRLSACREFCGVHNWQNGTRCRDDVKVLWFLTLLVWLVFEGSILTCAYFHSENILVTFIISYIVPLLSLCSDTCGSQSRENCSLYAFRHQIDLTSDISRFMVRSKNLVTN